MEDGRRVIRESDRRAIIRDGDRTFIRHDESDRFRRLGPNVRVERRGRETITIVPRPGGVEIVTIVDEDGRLIRRFRRERGREVVLIDNRFRGPGRPVNVVVGLPPPVISIPRERYVIDNRASRREYVQLFRAPPVERVERRYTLDEVRYSPNLRARMPRVDVDEINFESGSWEIPPSQYGVLEEIAQAMNEVIRSNPNEVFLIEGHTDATGSDEDNLSLSDRRAESVANVLTDEFQVPPENLTTQGYGESQLKVNTDGPERANRRVVLLRITPLITGSADAAPRTEPIPRAR